MPEREWGVDSADYSFGHGVYFANEAMTSMTGYSRATVACRHNADFKLTKATALVELGE
jgi:hypothetical protein